MAESLPKAPPRPASPRRPRRVLRWLAWGFGTVLLCVVGAISYITFVGLTIDASFLRASIAQTFSDNIGRPVRFEGAMELRISARPRLRVGDFRIGNAPGFGGGDFASLGEARLALDLWPLLFEKQLYIEELAGSKVRLLLQAGDGGRKNWTFTLPDTATAAAPQSTPGASIRPGQILSRLNIKKISLEGLNVEYIDADGTSRFFDLHTLTAQSSARTPFELALAGTVQKQFPYQLHLTGGTLADLASGKPWPFSLTVTFLSSTLAVNGSAGAQGGEFTFGLGTENLIEFSRLLQTELPDVGASGLAATIKVTRDRIAIRQLVGAMGKTTLTGELELDASGPKPRITGSLITPTLDLRPFLGEASGNANKKARSKDTGADDRAPPSNLSDLYRSIAGAHFDLSRLNALDADITLGVENWLSLPGDVRNARLQIALEDGILRAPLTASAAGVTMAGEVSADAKAQPPRFNLALGTSDSDLGDLAELLLGIGGVKGQLGRFGLALAAQGDRGADLVRSLDVSLEVDKGRFTYGNNDGGKPVRFYLEKLAVHLPPGKPLEGDMNGTLLGQRFAARLSAGALEPMMLGGLTPLDFTLRSGDVRARIHGTIEAPAEQRGPEIAFEFSAPRAGEMASWFGFEPGAQAPARISGKASLRTSQWQLRDFLLRLGRTDVSADLSRTLVNGAPMLDLRIDAGRIDVAQLEAMLPQSRASSSPAVNNEPATAALDIPLLPQDIDLSDANVAVRIKQFDGTAIKVRDASFDGRIRDGYMHPSPFSVMVEETAFTGAVSLDLRDQEPTAGFWLFANDLNVGELLRTLGVVRNLEANFSQFSFYAMARSSRLGDMLARSELLGSVGGGRIVLRDANTQAEARITIDKGELRADPGKPLGLILEGALDDEPIRISFDTARATELVNPRLPLPFILDAEAADTRVTLGGRIARPIGSELELALDAKGKRFDSLDKLARAELPPWGPWSATGRFRLSPRGYEVNGLRLQVGNSVLDGNGQLETETGRPRITVNLNSPVVQLDDFKLGNWSPVEKKPDEKPDAISAEEIRRKAARASDEAQKLLSPEMLRRQDVFLNVEVEQVLSGKDKLGAGRLQARLENGRADIGPIEVQVPGGAAMLRLGYEPTEQDVNVDLHIDVERFDYGVLARRIQPDTDLGGTFSVKMDVDSRARYLSDILRHGNGRIDFAVWPKNMKSGIFDLWAVNVLVALSEEVDPDKASKVNCAVGRFSLSDGKLAHKTIVLDTSRMRVSGIGNADFATEALSLRMRPQAKTAQFLSLATPIQVSGTFENFSIGVSPGDALETVARLATSIVWVPLQKLSGKKLPADGADVCNVQLESAALTR